jgi:hypothetical protein
MQLPAPRLNPKTFDKSKLQTLHFIDNEFVPSSSGKTFAVINPSTEEEFCRVAEGTKEDVDRAVASSKKAYNTVYVNLEEYCNELEAELWIANN